MFGNKLRSWMEAVRPKKKQQRNKDKKAAQKTPPPKQNTQNGSSFQNDIVNSVKTKPAKSVPGNGLAPQTPRYSGANLSSPESAYSTGYSTDGTSPGAPPEYYINIRTGTRYTPPTGLKSVQRHLPSPVETIPNVNAKSTLRVAASPTPRERISSVAVHHSSERTTVSMDYEVPDGVRASVTLHGTPVPSRLAEVVVSSTITSPRQRNRIRTNPWLPGSTLSPGSSCNGLHAHRHDALTKTTTAYLPYPSPTISRPSRRPSTTSSTSSCSSMSSSILHWDPTILCRPTKHNNPSGSDDDCTLNEMMGKYDESYVYEKETDILSDSDPTDCETDLDTGQDGGDEDDTCDLDFIDHGAHVVCEGQDVNTGHCTYHGFDASHRKVSRRRTTRKSRGERKKRRSASRKAIKTNTDGTAGSRSAGATPLSMRRAKPPTLRFQNVGESFLKRRSNSVSFSESPINTFDKRDKEADKKYKELIVEAEHILMSMKTSGLSPRRLPGPPNKRVELLRTTEISKPEVFAKNRLEDAQQHLKIPSTCLNSARLSPQRNHITNFISHNTPVMARRGSANNSPLMQRNKNLPRKGLKHKKNIKDKRDSSSSEEEYKGNGFCPQSEPVKRKVYVTHKTVAFNLNETSYKEDEGVKNETVRQQVLANTIANLKRSLEDQSASLKQVYKGSDRL